jgi:hypothetical protein
MSRLSTVFFALEAAYGPDAAAPLLAEFAVPILETSFQVILNAGRGTDVFGLAAAIRMILSHPFMKKNPEALVDLIFRIAPACRPDVAQTLITQAYDGTDLVALLETLRSLMLEMRSINPGESVEMFSRARAEVMDRITALGVDQRDEDQAADASAAELSGITERLRDFSLTRR